MLSNVQENIRCAIDFVVDLLQRHYRKKSLKNIYNDTLDISIYIELSIAFKSSQQMLKFFANLTQPLWCSREHSTFHWTFCRSFQGVVLGYWTFGKNTLPISSSFELFSALESTQCVTPLATKLPQAQVWKRLSKYIKDF
jgi:hypothetical protein